jgi:hypothetical protein
MRWGRVAGIFLGALLFGCGADLNPQPEPPGGSPPATGGPATGGAVTTGATSSSTSSSSTTATGPTGTVTAGSSTGAGGAGGSSGSGGSGGAPGAIDASADATGEGPRDGADAGTDASADAPVRADASDGPNACSFADMLNRGCTPSRGCVAVIHQTDCCGNTVAIGLNAADQANFMAQEQACVASYPHCGCPMGPTRTDSGETVGDPGMIKVKCTNTNVCRTYVNNEPL